MLPLYGERKPTPFAEQSVKAGFGQFSPDGHWIAYSARDAKRDDVYLAPYPGPGAKVLVSPAGGSTPRWRHDGKELFYVSADAQLMSAEVNLTAGRAETGRVRPLFGGVTARYFDVSADGQRFLIAMPREQTATDPLVLVQNWNAALKK